MSRDTDRKMRLSVAGVDDGRNRVGADIARVAVDGWVGVHGGWWTGGAGIRLDADVRIRDLEVQL